MKLLPQRILAYSLSCMSLLILISFSNCGKDDAPAKSRSVKFEVSGNYSGTLSAAYLKASGGGTSETITALPWTKEVSYEVSVPSTSITVGGTGGLSGQTITVKVLAGGKQISSTQGVATASGSIVVTSPVYIF